MTHTELINKWPSISAFAEDIGVSYGTAKAIRRRGIIPASYWAVAVTKGQGRGVKEVTLEALAQAAAKTEQAA